MMKILFLALLSFSVGQCQNKINTDEQAILLNELAQVHKYYTQKSNIKTFVKDSLLIGQKVLEPERSMPELKQYLINTEKLSEAEVNDIFGAGSINMFPIYGKKEHWTATDFPGHKILFYNDVLKKKLDGKFGMYNPLYFSRPLIRRDRKYAFIQVENSHEGGALHIYKCENEKWFFYKSVPLYLTD